MSQTRVLLCALGILGSIACDRRIPHAVVTVTDPDGVAAEAWVLGYGQSPDNLSAQGRDQPFPLTLLLTAEEEGPHSVWIEAWNVREHPLARGTATVTLSRDDLATAEVALAPPCESNGDCADGMYCNGVESCSGHVCHRGDAPCLEAPFACVQLECVERARSCNTMVFHEQCDAIDIAGISLPTYCDAAHGCVRGKACSLDSECGNGVACDGEEVCFSGHCVGASPPDVDDGNSCTVDVCTEPNGRTNVPDLSADGAPCSRGGTSGLCLGGVCQTSACGDGLVDPRSEDCDDGNDDPNDECDQCLRVVWSARVLAGLGTTAGDPLRIALSHPTDLTVDSEGSVYVSDRALERVLRLSPDGRVVSTMIGGSTWTTILDLGGLRSGSSVAYGHIEGIAADGSTGLLFSTGFQLLRLDVSSGVVVPIPNNESPAEGWIGFVTSLLASDGLGMVVMPAGSTLYAKGRDGSFGLIAGTVGQSGYAGDSGPASSALLDHPEGLAIDARGIFVADTQNHVIRLIDPDGTISTIAGDGTPGYAGDGGPALLAHFDSPKGLAIDGQGRLYIADSLNHVVRRIDTNGNIDTVAGTGVAGFSGDNASALGARLRHPTRVALDPAGNLYILDVGNRRVRRVSAANNFIRTALGTGGAETFAEGLPATRAVLAAVTAMAEAPNGDVCFSDLGAVRCVVAGRIRTRFAPELPYRYTGWLGFRPNGNLAYAQNGRIYEVVGNTAVAYPDLGYIDDQRMTDVAMAPGNIAYSVDSFHGVVRRLDLVTGQSSIIAGTLDQTGFAGDGGPPSAALFNAPYSIALERTGNLLIGDLYNHRLRRIDFAANRISTVAGNGNDETTGDGGLATAAGVRAVYDITIDRDGTAVFIDNCVVRRLRSDGTIVRVAGLTVVGAEAGFCVRGQGDGELAVNALIFPGALLLHSNGNLYAASAAPDDIIRIVDGATAKIDSYAGRLYPLDDGTVESAGLTAPTAIDIGEDLDGAKVLLVADDGYVRGIDPITGSIKTIYGRAIGGGDVFAASNPLETGRSLWVAMGLVWDPVQRRIYVNELEEKTYVVGGNDVAVNFPLAIDYANSVISPVLPNYPDGNQPFSTAELFVSPSGMLLDAVSRRLYIADTGHHTVRLLDISSDPPIIRPFAGTGVRGDNGDEQDAQNARFDEPVAMALGPGGAVYIADRGNNKVRRVSPSGTISLVLGDGQAASSGEGGPARSFPVMRPSGLAVDRHGNLYASSSNAIRLVLAGEDGVATGADRVISIFGKAPRDTFPASDALCLAGLRLDDGPNGEPDAILYAVDTCRGTVLRLDRGTVPFGG